MNANRFRQPNHRIVPVDFAGEKTEQTRMQRESEERAGQGL
jgi:hypothetical protein